MSAQHRRDHHADDHDQRVESGLQRRESEYVDCEHGGVGHRPHHPDSVDQHEHGGLHDHPVPHEMWCQHRVPGPPLLPYERIEEDECQDHHHRADGTDPLEALSSKLYEQQDVQEENGEEGYPLGVHHVLGPLQRTRELPDGEEYAHDRQGHVDVEYPVPGDGLGYVSAYQRTDPAPYAEHGAHEPLHPRPVPRGIEIRNGGRGDRDEYPSAEPLHRAAQDQHLHAGRQAREDRTDDEEPQAQQEQRLPAVYVGQLPRDWDHDGLAEEIRRDHPRVEIGPVQIRRDHRSARAHDRPVEARYQHCQEDPGHGDAADPRIDVPPGDLFFRDLPHLRLHVNQILFKIYK